MKFATNIFICFISAAPSIFNAQENTTDGGALSERITQKEVTSPAINFTFPSSDVEYCKTSSGEEGICMSLGSCAYAMQALRRGITSSHCGFNESYLLVCCPYKLENTTDGGALSERITQKEVASPAIKFRCGRRGLVEVIKNGTSFQRRKRSPAVPVVGGLGAFKNSWPWMALLGRRKGTAETFFCSAIVINNNFLITAAHCVLSLDPFFVRLGEHDYGPEFGENYLQAEEDVGVDSILLHPKYGVEKGYHDIALIKLAKIINFRREVSPICLPWGSLSTEDLVNEIVTVAGWGRLSYGGDQSKILQEVNVTVFDPSRCEEPYSSLKSFHTSFPEGLTRENIVCAGDVDGGKDACEGDSGGPMMHYTSETGTYTLAAIVSKGFGCGLEEFPGLYAPIRNSETLQWIKDIAFSDG